MDILDIAKEVEEKGLSIAIKSALEQKTVIMATGKCLCCDEPLAPDLRWCDKECLDDWEKEQKRLERIRAVRSW